MRVDRRSFIGAATLAAGAAISAQRQARAMEAPPFRARMSDGEWANVRAQFPLAPDYIHMSALLIASHPRIVSDSIELHRRSLDANPVVYVNENNRRLQNEAIQAAAHYLWTDAANIALTDSTTMGIGLALNGLRLRPGEEILTTDQDYYVTHESARVAALRTGARVRRIPLYDRVETVSEDEIIGRLAAAITPATRVLALTWVHSSTGLKIPAQRISQMLRDMNARRGWTPILFCLDGVHGFGNQDIDFPRLGCDFFAAGCHKWLFGPRGTGILISSPQALRSVEATIPSFIDASVWDAWIDNTAPFGAATGRRMTPGGFKAFEHLWSLAPAFQFHRSIGKERVAHRTAQLASQLKEGLAGMNHVRLLTPRPENLSAGIVSFDIDGMSPQEVVERLRERRILGSVAPYAQQHARLTPSIVNSPQEIEFALNEIRGLAGGRIGVRATIFKG